MSNTHPHHIGALGEEIACIFLEQKGWRIIRRNYTRPWGEIDIIAQHKDRVHFVEVKSVSCENISHETANPAEKVHTEKQKRLGRAIQTYLSRYASREIPWIFSVIVVYIDPETYQARIQYLKDIALPA